MLSATIVELISNSDIDKKPEIRASTDIATKMKKAAATIPSLVSRYRL
ncbi:MAG: hypothetical protein LUO84_07300 [Methanomassiliicoccales archaeon]|nr:hypothetical protein [Methanomassiliicoccales archaeon]